MHQRKKAHDEKATADEIVPETDSDARRGSDPSAALERLKKELEACKKERQEYLDGWQRARADLINMRKQFEADREHFLRFAEHALITDLIPVLDSFDMAFQNPNVWGRVDEEWRRGIEHIYQQLLSTLSSRGVEQYDPQGTVFDPSAHETIASAETDDPNEDNRIVAVLKKGYRLKGKVIRPAHVKVAHRRA